ncbi:MAG TPA: metallopeptidase TldD-related protein [Gemmatimonadaceae bacterium]
MSRHLDRLVRLDDSHRILSREECDAIAKRVFSFAQGGGETRVKISSWWQGELRWARNRVSLAGDRRDIKVSITRGQPFSGQLGTASTNQLDGVSLESAVRAAERSRALADYNPPPPPFAPPFPPPKRPASKIWSDATYGLTTEARGEVVRGILAPAEARGMLSAGYIEVRAATFAELSSAAQAGEAAEWETPYIAWTQAQCSMAVRDPLGTGSGWAGISSFDWGKIDPEVLAARALEKCVASRNPVGLEPGRYTVVLEPQAVADIVAAIPGTIGRRSNESGIGPFALAMDDALHLWRTKLGLKVVDERVTISHDYADPGIGIVPPIDAMPDPIAWIDHGVLKAMPYDRSYALRSLNEPMGVRSATGYRMSGGETTVEEMIRMTKRGLLVTRFSNVELLDARSLLLGGLTRDGLWLIESGKITKPVKNFRFTESPLFVLNSLDELGPPMKVFHATSSGGALSPVVVPPLKARDFSFTSLVDAV